MSRRLAAAAMSMLAIVGITLIAAAPSSTAAVRGATAEKRVGRRAEHGKASHNDTSSPLREIRPARPVPRREHPDSPMPAPSGPIAADPVVQPSAPGAPSASSATNFAGIGVTGSAPSDANGAVGPNDYVDMVNARIQVFAKDGTTLLGPVPTNTLWSGFGGECETNDDGDGTVRYDALADRWIVSQFALGPSGKGPFAQCVAVSTTSDPTGSYYRYAFGFANFPDYPKLGIWPDAYYQTMNTFGTTGSFLGAETCAYDRTMMLSGQLAGLQCFNTTTAYGAILPGDLDGTTPPPAGAPDMQIGLGTDNTHLASFAFHVDWTPGNANSTLTESDVPVAAYSTACGGGVCVPQLGTNQQLDSLADRMMYRYAYRNFGDHESWVATYSVDAGGPSAPRWTELRRTPPATTGSPVVYQQSTYAPDSNWRWMGSTAMDAAGDIALGYSESSPTMKPAIAYTGHQPTDALGVMEPETVLVHGAGAQTGGLNRWGDYSSMSVDPSDGCTFWYTNQFLPADGSFNWQTQVGSFSFPACATRGDPDFSAVTTPPAATLAAPGSTSTTVSIGRTAGPAQAVALSASGLPSGASATFSSASVTPGATQPGTSTMTVIVPAATVPGTYPVTITATGTSTSHTATFTLTVPGATITNGGFESGLSGWTTSIGSASVTSSGPHTGTSAAMLGAATATNGDSSIRQAFTPTQPSTLSFWYEVTCPDTVVYDWATATLYDNAAATQTTVLPRTCTNSHSWVNVTAPVPASMVGHALTLTLTSHDDAYPGDPTFTAYDDVTLVPTTPPDFSLSSSPASQSAVAGTSASYTLTTAAVGGFNGQVALSVSGLPTGVTAGFTPTSITGSGTSTMALTVAATTVPGTYGLTVTGTSGTLSHTAPATLVVTSAPDFSLSSSPASQSAVAGTSASYTLTTAAVGGFNGQVALSVSGLPTGVTAGFTPTSITGSGTSTMALTVAATTVPGTYGLTVTGTSGTLSHTAPATLVVTPPPPGFVVTATPTTQSAPRGTTITYVVTVTPVGGFTGTVSLRMTSSSSGPTGAFAPLSLKSGNSALKVNTRRTLGTFTLTITGTSGRLTSSTTVTLTVTT